MKSPLIHLATEVFDTTLAIIPEKLEVILRSAVGPRLTVDTADWKALHELVETGVLKRNPNIDPKLLTASWNDDEDDNRSSKPYKVTDAGVAIIPISGVLMKKGGWMSALSGCSSYDGIGKALSAAMSDPMVKGVLFDVNSPGGSTNGCFELTDRIHAYRGAKPMYAIANDLSASAAYSLASAADRVFVTRTGACGSIGVFSLHCSQSKLDDKIGVEYTYIHYGAKKVDGNEHEALSKSARSDIQAEVDRQGNIFTNTVSRNRRASFESIRDLQAGVLFADRSVPLLADIVGDFDSCLTELSSKVNKSGGTLRMTGGKEVVHPSASQPPVHNTTTGAMPEGAAEMEATATELQAALDKANQELAGLRAAAALSAETDRVAKAAAAIIAETDRVAKAAAAIIAADEAKKKEATADPSDPDNDEDCSPDMKKKGAIAFRMITELGALSSLPKDAAKLIAEGKTVGQARKALQDLRATADAALPVSGHFGAVSTDALSTIEAQTDALVASNPKLSRSRAMEQVLARNPVSYKKYLDERNSQTSQAHGGNASPYMQSLYSRYSTPLGSGLGAGTSQLQ